MLEMITLTAAQFEALKRQLPAVTREQLMAVYGISESTWTKLRTGLPIRASTFSRIMARAPAEARHDMAALARAGQDHITHAA